MASEREQVYADRDWWRFAGDLVNLELRGWTFRSSASFLDRATDQTVEMTGALAGRLHDLRARLSQAGAGGVVDARQIAERVAGLVSLNKEAFAVEKAILDALAASPSAASPVDLHGAWTNQADQKAIRSRMTVQTASAGEPDGWQWRMKNPATGELSSWQDGRKSLSPEMARGMGYEERALYATPPAPVQTASVEAVRDVLNMALATLDVIGKAGAGTASDYARSQASDFRAVLAALTAPTQGNATQIAMGRGLVDVTRIDHEGRSGILFRPRDSHIPIGEEGELQPGDYWPVAGDVVIWIENEGGAQVIQKYLSPFLSSPSPAGGVREALEEAGTQYRYRQKGREKWSAWGAWSASLQSYQDFEMEKRTVYALSSPATGEVVERLICEFDDGEYRLTWSDGYWLTAQPDGVVVWGRSPWKRDFPPRKAHIAALNPASGHGEGQ